MGKKATSMILGTEKTQSIHVFEGFMDFLTVMTAQEQLIPKSDVMVLNSTQMQAKAAQQINHASYQKVYLWLDNDTAGRQALADFQMQLQPTGKQVHAMNNHYAQGKDVNSHWLKEGTLAKQTISPRPDRQSQQPEKQAVQKSTKPFIGGKLKL